MEVKYIPCGVDLNIFDPQNTEKAKIRGGEGKAVILYSGLIRTFTGCHYLPGIAERVIDERRDVLFIVVGDGPYLDTLRRRVHQRGLSKYFLFTGRVAHDMVPRYVKAADICLATTPPDPLTNLGVFPIKIVEYMAMGKPVVSTNIREVKNILGYNCGIYCPPEEMGGRVLELLEDERRGEAMGERAHKRAVSTYSWEVIVRDLIDYWLHN